MKYIDKSLNADRCNAFIDQFLALCKDRAWIPFYPELGRTRYRKEVRHILVDEQERHCCYCMRNLRSRETTIEHVIPTSEPRLTLDQYKTYTPFFDQVIHLDAYLENKTEPPYPHTVAYSNMVASCSGILSDNSFKSCCCNNKRGNKHIIPLIYLPEIEDIIAYTKTGLMYPTDRNPLKMEAIEVLKLNHEVLKEVRFLWFRIKRLGIHFDAKSNRAEVLKRIFDKRVRMDIPEEYKKYYRTDYFWNLFLDYDWFYQYYTV
jgi:hypothetical protein